VQKFSKLKLQSSDSELPLRPGYGVEGKAITVRANHFALAIKIPKGAVYEYNISFHPETKIKRIRKRLLQILEGAPEFQPYRNIVAHDWSEKLVAAEKLPSPNNKPLEITVKLFDDDEKGPTGDSKTYAITISYVNEIDSGNLNRSVATAPAI
jgi:eukaryotic translation initiation factor 2C